MIMKKRAFDLAILIVGAPIWIPTVGICLLLIWVFDGRPLIYWSERRVFRAQRLRIPKLRVMRRDAEKIANRATVSMSETRFLNLPLDSPLYSRIGRPLERLCMTELPQLFFVLVGKMTLIGNRPLPEDVIAALNDAYPHAEERFLTCCGLTGPAQLVGRERLGDEDRLRLEIAYSRATLSFYSARLDFVILLSTILIASRLQKPLTVDEVERLVYRFSMPAFRPEVSLLPDAMPD